MPLIYVPWVTRTDLKAHPEWLYLFGDNEQRRGMGGQAKECRYEPNAVGVATKRIPSRSAVGEFWSDDEYDRVTAIIHADLARAFSHVDSGGTVICPKDGLGTGLSELPTRAPRVFAFLQSSLDDLKRRGEAHRDQP